MRVSCAPHARERYQRKEVTSMHKTVAAGAAAGAIGGVVFAGLMRLFPVGAEHRTVIAIGAVFGWLLGRSALDKARAAMWGGLYGVGWWIAAELVLIPSLLVVWP